MMRLILTTIIPALLFTFSFLAVNNVAVAGSADGKAVYCECEEGKRCGNLSLSSTVFGVFFESGTVDMKYPNGGYSCERSVCLGGLKQDRYDVDGPYEDGYEVIRWSSKTFFGTDYSLDRETLLLTETVSGSTFYKRCKVMAPAQAVKKIEDFISDFNDEIEAERKEKTKKNKI